jgi:hypothetical protein
LIDLVCSRKSKGQRPTQATKEAIEEIVVMSNSAVEKATVIRNIDWTNTNTVATSYQEVSRDKREVSAAGSHTSFLQPRCSGTTFFVLVLSVDKRNGSNSINKAEAATEIILGEKYIIGSGRQARC